MSQAHPEHISDSAGAFPVQAWDVENQGDVELSDSPEGKQSAFKNLGILDRFLALWIFLAMAIGIILGNFVPNTGPALQKGKFVGVSVPIGEYCWRQIVSDLQHTNSASTAIGLLVMMYPILCKVRYESLHHVFRTRQIWIQVAFSIFVNWIIAPFFMVG